MGPFTKNTLSRESSPKAVKTVPKVVTSNVSKKQVPASAKKHTPSKLGELGFKSFSSTASTTASKEAGSADRNDVVTFETIPDTASLPHSSIPIISAPSTLDSNFPPTQEPIFSPLLDSNFPPSSFDSSLNSSVPDWVLNFQKQFRDHELRFEKQESRLHHLESLIQENAQLKETVAEQANLIAELRARLLAVPETESQVEPMMVDSLRDLSTNGSKWSTAPSTAIITSTPQIPTVKPTKIVQVKPTFAQVASQSTAKPARAKRTPAKKVLSSTKLATVARPFVTSQDGPTGFKYVYIGRSRKITRADTRSRFKLVGIDNSRILDINFPAHGVIGVLVHLQYVEKFASVMKKIGADLINDFDPLDPANLADPLYNSYTTEAREDTAFNLQHNRCINALTHLRNTKPYQVKPVGYSFVELGFISVEDVLACASSNPPDPKAKSHSDIGALFNVPKDNGNTPATSTPSLPEGIVVEDDQQMEHDSDGDMQEANYESPEEAI